MKFTASIQLLYILVLSIFFYPAYSNGQIEKEELRDTISILSGFSSRTTGSPGYQNSLEYISTQFEALGLEPKSYLYELPVRKFQNAELTIDDNTYLLQPFNYNAITPAATGGIVSAPLYYVGKGSLQELDGKNLEDSVVLIDFDSGQNWQQLPAIGVKAAIFLKSDQADSNIFYREKKELTPLQFPCFLMDRDQAISILGSLQNNNTPVRKGIKLQSESVWKNIIAENLYTLIEGTDQHLKNELLVLESFFDNEEFLAGNSPGADSATSMATFLSVAQELTIKPPKRSVLLLATSGNAQTLAGIRDLIWSINSRSKELRKKKKLLQQRRKNAARAITTLKDLSFPLIQNSARDATIKAAIKQSLDFEVDKISRQLIELRLQKKTPAIRQSIKKVASERFLYRQLGWADSFHDLPLAELDIFKEVIPKAIWSGELLMEDVDAQTQTLESALTFRNLVHDFEKPTFISLHLSSHGDGVGAFNRGWLYNLKKTINRTSSYSTIAEVLEKHSAPKPGVQYKNTLRPSHLRSWDSWFYDKPNLGGEVSALGGYLGLSLVTTGDSRSLWGTPDDTPEHINWNYLTAQANLVSSLIKGVANADTLHTDNPPRNGFVTVTGRTNVLLQGELFANYPAADTTILGYQGLKKVYSQVDQAGYFQIKGLADKKHVLDKLIIEGYKYDQESGRPIWAIDKKLTGKSNYRLKLIRKSMKTDLILFHCRETTLFNLLEPRKLTHMTKLHLFDGRRDAPPEHYWYSRIDTRDSIISSIYTEPGTLLKLTLSDTVLTNKMILTNGTEEKKLGLGYKVDDHPTITKTLFHAAKDGWTLLLPRINNLEKHGIYDKKINSLKKRGLAALQLSRESYAKNIYSLGQKSAAEAMALAARVYVQVEKTQKDVLFGVLFYIALFVPFAFVMERFLFNFNTIYKRIVGFTVILLLVIVVIYNVHPAFNLAYSPMIVILAFFIIGLSFMVTLIIFFRFEEEMVLLQNRSTHKKADEISKWKAFVAAFFLGVSNLRRRKLRSLLTCTTLIILTFTIMSFTTIKSSQKQVKLSFQDEAPYSGLLLKKMNWRSLPSQAENFLVLSLSSGSTAAPRVWLESKEPTRPPVIPLRKDNAEINIQGLIGLSPNETKVTGIHRILQTGRWFRDSDRAVIILEQKIADSLGVQKIGQDKVLLWGSPFTVIGTFLSHDLEETIDLDGEPLTPVIFPDEANTDLTEAEMEALESGDDVRSFQSRYQHIAASDSAIVPAKTLIAAGGKLKNIAATTADQSEIDPLARKLSDRFSLTIFTGEKDGVWLQNISDTMNYSGVPNIIIPLLISILIVLNTMISSVYERKSEIGVYTSVGLAPSHVGFLFVAEAMALAVISVVLGYLIAQIMAAFLSTTSLWEGITVNYSSMAGVAAMVLVISVVLISVAYPARVAARIAIPDVNQTFKLPRPVDNKIVVTLPFLMKYKEHQSIGGFIHDYFTSHRDVSHGIFSTGPVEVVFSCSTVADIAEMVRSNQDDDDLHCLHIRSNVWLAPFDFGILQTVDVQFCPAQEGEEFLEIKITLARQAGEADIWRRINTSFLHELRKQLLIWRSFDQSVHQELEYAFKNVISGNHLITGDG